MSSLIQLQSLQEKSVFELRIEVMSSNFLLLDIFFVLYCSFLSEGGRGINQSSPTEYKRGKDHAKFTAH